MKPGIYERVSSDSQSLASQHAELAKWAEGKEARWFSDQFTGTTMDRPGWQALWRECCKGRIDTIVIYRLDRLARTARGLITLRDELVARRINLISLRDAVDLSTPSGRMFFTILASVAEFETEVRRERQVAGIATAKARDAYKGRKPGQMNARTRELLGTVYAMSDAGVSVLGIAKATKLSRPCVYRVLQQRSMDRKEG